MKDIPEVHNAQKSLQYANYVIKIMKLAVNNRDQETKYLHSLCCVINRPL